MFFPLLVVFSTILLVFIFSIFTKKPENAPPGYPIIGCLISFSQNRHQLLSWYTNLLSNSPSLTIVINRLGALRNVVTANPSNVEYILKTNFNNYPKGELLSQVLEDLLGHGIFNVDGELWSAQRKLASHEFSTKSLREFVVKTVGNQVEKRLLPFLETAIERKNVIDLQEVLNRFTFDTVCQVTLGFDPFCLNSLDLPLPPLVQAFDTATMISAIRGRSPMIIIWKIKRLLNIGTEKKLKQANEVIYKIIKTIIHNKKKKMSLGSSQADRVLDKADESDLLSRFILAGHDEKMLVDMVISFILAGRDTTASGMTWLFWLFSQNPTVEINVLREIETLMLQNGDGDGDQVCEDLKDMNYLKACLYESMRLYPQVAWDSKQAAENDVLPDGTKVKKGDKVTYFPYGMGRMKELWGEDRLEFKPDRWFNENGMFKNVSPFKYPVFQGGPRICLGKEMAIIQMKYVVSWILKRYEIKPVDLENQPVFLPFLTAHMYGGLKVTVRKRSI